MKLQSRIERLETQGREWLLDTPVAVIQLACAQNPWFTEYDIRYALQQTALWFEPGKLQSFMAAYPTVAPDSDIQVGLILAGNIPAAGFHDVLMLLLSGMQGQVKCSHQDAVIIPAFYAAVFSGDMPFTFVSQITDAGALIASGSNLSTRHISNAWQDIPVLLRGSRFSLAVLDGSESLESLVGLAKDILQYNGLGCRSVSQLLVPEGYDFHALFSVLRAYPESSLSYPYRRKVAWEQAIDSMGAEPDRQIPDLPLVLRHSDTMRAAEAGVLHVIHYTAQADIADMITRHKAEIQAVSGGSYLPLGSLQSPKLDDFADSIDTMAWLRMLKRD
jgi:hypothetical protein